MHTVHGSLASSLDRILDILVRASLFDSNGKVYDGDVRGGNTERHARQLAVEFWKNNPDRLGCTSARRNDVVHGRPAGPPVLSTTGRTVNSQLIRSRGMDGRHQALHDAEVLVNDLCAQKRESEHDGRAVPIPLTFLSLHVSLSLALARSLTSPYP